ncbi:MAG: protein phosphatase 2C family protein, partial [Lachnospiraceae bacterium]|nr:protein phosphatase 2C family protein [Lachnospiraceae bacterium]
MRKYNSSFKTAFLSEAGSGLKNNDYFAYVELDKYACYVMADGITDLRDSESAKEAIHTIIGEFQNAPSMSARALERYLRAANRELKNRRSYEKLKASVTVVVTNYEKMRYAFAGNTRLRVYRNGRPLYLSYDMSLSQDLVKEERITPDAVARHIERNNLHTCLGMDRFTPFVSSKIKLKDADIIALYTRGVWENIDEGELKDLIEDTGNDPAECCNQVEDLLMSKQPKNLENYTFVSIFVEKIFLDPKRKKKIKMMIIIGVIAALVIIAIIVVIIVLSNIRERTRTDMGISYQNMQDYIEDGNFVRAGEECQEAVDSAKKIFDKEMQDQLDDYQKFLEAVTRADGIYDEGKYDEA